jgi:tetraacyldisaccharide 4'-kinase
MPASWLYGLAVGGRNRRFDRGRGVAEVDVPVVSVGNITAGGAGKTPTVMWIAAWLRTAGHHPAIAMRGYAAGPGEPSDEQQEHRWRLPDVHVVADPDRAASLRAFLPTHPEVDCVLLDDGFQHRGLHRDLDLVLIDATRNTMGDQLLPWGYLREPTANLRRADAVVVTRAASVDGNLAAQIERHHGRPPVAWCRHAWTRLQIMNPDDGAEVADVPWLRGKRVVTLLGVGNPPKLVLARSLCEGADAFVMTGKDWVKARHLIDLSSWPVPIVVPWLEIEIFDGADALKALILETVS